MELDNARMYGSIGIEIVYLAWRSMRPTDLTSKVHRKHQLGTPQNKNKKIKMIRCGNCEIFKQCDPACKVL